MEVLAVRELLTLFERLGFVTNSPSLIPLLQQARKAAEVSDVTVLLDGETGTGKQVLARGIHQLDQKRRSFGFVTVHCGTISEGIAESELFGHQRGAFSGALAGRKGLFQAAERGTLLLDDVNDLSLCLQTKLLDVIQRGAVRPVGCDHEINVDVRIIAACNKPLEPLVREGRFRQDLYHRLNVVKLCLPPLRTRIGDLEALMTAFARRHCHLYPGVESVDESLLRYLDTQTFPGNIRELENTVQRMLFLKVSGTSFTLKDWRAQEADAPLADEPSLNPLMEAAQAVWTAISRHGIPYRRAMEEVERQVLQSAVCAGGKTRREIAAELNTSERTLYYRMRARGVRTTNVERSRQAGC
jgi:transcriptional regulator with PAS, ATPase and Fis domain